MLLNLLDNAVKYGPPRQTVTVSVRGRRVVPDSTHTLTANAGASKETTLDLALAPTVKPGLGSAHDPI